jgi:translation initiation factor IF-2
MNITQLARRLRVPADELREKLPELGFDIGQKALKVPDRDVGRIMGAWKAYQKRQYYAKKREEQLAREEMKKKVIEGTAEKIEIPEVVTVREFAERLNMPIAKVMQELMRAGILASLNERIDFETATIIAQDLGYITEHEGATSEGRAEDEGVDRLAEAMKESEGSDLVTRPPVIVIMGHVDHGKTLLLDTIRKTNIVGGEAGGITQHIGAYQVEHKEQKLTFIDTPGHEAFTVMRSRGAKVADIAILVVAADDGIQPQTKEAIDIVKASGMPFIVAINKIDKEGANLDKVKGQLTEFDLVAEDYGGKTICVPISAKTGQNIDQLLDMLLLVFDLEKEKIVADPDRKALGTVIESHIDKGQGPVATILVQTGTLNVGDIVGLRGVNFGKVRAMKSWNGGDVKSAPPSTPVRVLGFKDTPSVGDVLEVPENPKSLEKLKARTHKRAGAGEITIAANKRVEGTDVGEHVTLNVIIKADVLGSLEAIIGMVEKIDNPHVSVKIVSRGLGNVTDADVLQADATGAFVAAFNTKATKSAQRLLRDKDVAYGEYTVIYKLFDVILEKLQALVPSEKVYTDLGTLKVLATFQKAEKGVIAGGAVLKGRAVLGAIARVLRDDEVQGEGKIVGLQAGKVDVKDVEAGSECGFSFEGKTRLEVGDILEFYTEEEKERTVEMS